MHPAEAIAKATPRRHAKLRCDGRYAVGADLADRFFAAAKRSAGRRHEPAERIPVRDICQDFDLGRVRG